MFEINSHELIFLENKRKSKTNSFIIFKLSDNNISLSNKKINISKKNNHIDVNSSDKNTLNKINDEIKENLSNYISEHELDVKNNLTKVLFNDIVTNNKLYFNLGDNINDIDKAQKYDCTFNIPYILLIFTSNKVSEVNLKVKLSSIGSDNSNVEENETLGSMLENSSNTSNGEELIDDNECDEQVPSNNDNNDNNNSNDNNNNDNNDNNKKKKNNKKQQKKIIKVDTEPELEEPIKKKRGRPSKK